MQWLGLLPVMAISLTVPGMVVLRRTRWHPLESLCCSVALSLFVVYIAAFAATSIGMIHLEAALMTVVLLCIAAIQHRHWRSVFGRRDIRRVMATLGVVVLWSLLLQSVLRHYGGANWSGDWYEHYQRAAFFQSYPKDLDFLFIERYLLPARPPLQNVVTAHFLSLFRQSFPVFQVVSTVLGALVVLPLCLLLRLLGSGWRRGVVALGCLLPLSPVFCQNVTYTWTRLLCAFFVVLAIALYVRAGRRLSRGRMVASFATLAAGFLVHYSAGPFLVAVAAHYLVVRWWQRPRRIRELAEIVVCGSAVLATWFAWSIIIFGVGPTVGSNTTVTDAHGMTVAEKVARAGTNFWLTVSPVPRVPGEGQGLAASNAGVRVRDAVFLLYQGTIVFGFGIAGWLGLSAAWCGLSIPRRERRFWIWVALSVVVLGTAVVSTDIDSGVAHVCMQPLVLVGIAGVAAAWSVFGPWLRGALLFGALTDFGLGVLLHFMTLSVDSGAHLGVVERFNIQIKARAGLVFIGDHTAAITGPMLIFAGALGLSFLVRLWLLPGAERDAHRRSSESLESGVP